MLRNYFKIALRNLLTERYFVLVMIAFIVIIPVTYLATQNWLKNFAYYIDISTWMYIKSCGLVLLITVFTVTFQSLKSVGTNPAHVLRNE